MPLQIENGSGRADAESFVSTTEISDWASARNLPFPTNETDREVAARKAADYLCNGARFKRWRGTPLSPLQALPYPRVGVVTYDDRVLPDGTIPLSLKKAQCALAVLSAAGVDLQPSFKQGGAMLVSSSIGPISKTYAQSTKSNPYSPFPAETLLTEVIGYLAPLLYTSGDDAEVTYLEGEVSEDYQQKTYANNNG